MPVSRTHPDIRGLPRVIERRRRAVDRAAGRCRARPGGRTPPGPPAGTSFARHRSVGELEPRRRAPHTRTERVGFHVRHPTGPLRSDASSGPPRPPAGRSRGRPSSCGGSGNGRRPRSPPTNRPITADAASVFTSQPRNPPSSAGHCVGDGLLGVMDELVHRVPAELVHPDQDDVATDPEHRRDADGRGVLITIATPSRGRGRMFAVRARTPGEVDTDVVHLHDQPDDAVDEQGDHDRDDHERGGPQPELLRTFRPPRSAR